MLYAKFFCAHSSCILCIVGYIWRRWISIPNWWNNWNFIQWSSLCHATLCKGNIHLFLWAFSSLWDSLFYHKIMKIFILYLVVLILPVVICSMVSSQFHIEFFFLTGTEWGKFFWDWAVHFCDVHATRLVRRQISSCLIVAC